MSFNFDLLKQADIKCKYLLSGYIREIQDTIPKDNNYFIIPLSICDINNKNERITVMNKSILNNNGGASSILLTKIASKVIHIWKFKVDCCIEIPLWSLLILYKYYTNEINNGYAWSYNSSYLTIPNEPGLTRELYGNVCKNGDIIIIW